ncbi:succinate dehydrogenase cytochrome b subunit [uncultured Mesonia sp.]|uniref:succinate dehydrogenase cytochrome b subunit n=1 Tax=uncultured Mesonia sp. TaxID=399731 RepID=UPI00374EFE36
MLGFSSTISRKYLMAITGLFLCLFLVIHLLGNFQLLLPEDEAQLQYNAYSAFLSGNILVKIIAYVLYISIILHSIDAIYLSFKSRKSKKTRYRYDARKRASKWYSRQMMLLGVILFAFLVIHFYDFWYPFKFGELTLDQQGNKDLYQLVIASFQNIGYVAWYSVAILALFFHLLHGFFSAFRSLGLYHPYYAQIIKLIGVIFSLLICIGYLGIPIYIFISR